MFPEIDEVKVQLTEADVARVEKKYGFTFPEEYRNFLFEYNGGSPEPCAFRFAEGSYGESCINRLFAIYDGEHSNFEDYYERFKIKRPRIPEEMVAIANDPGGNLILLSVAGETRGWVYFWDHELPLDGGPRKISLINKSFDDFINGLVDEV